MRTAQFLIALLFIAASLRAEEPTPAHLDFFEKKIRPLLINNCYACHSADTKPAGGLRLDDRNGILRGGLSGPAVVVGSPEKSLVIARISHADPKKRMPKEGDVLTSTQIGDVATWIREGLAWPVEAAPAIAPHSESAYQRIRERHWAFQPVRKPVVPAVSNTSWSAGDIDRFILAKLEARHLKPVSDASAQTLVRRVTYDLTGLPPTQAEIEAFVADQSPRAYERLVDRLLASPRYGERWGRHWLDVARYGESSGPSRNIPYPFAYRYRDYVIDAVNRDVPYDRFLLEQIAGDLLPAKNVSEKDVSEKDRLQTATGFLALGPKDVNQRFVERFVMDNAAEQIDTLTRSTLAMTVGCARCHDHKFDPIPTADYYALAGIFTSIDDAVGVRNKMGGAGLDYYDPKMLVQLASYVPAASPEKVAALEAEVAAAKLEFEAMRDSKEGLTLGPDGKPRQQAYRIKWQKIQAQLLELSDPAVHGYAVHGIREGKNIGDTAIRIRGEAERMGEVVPRGFLTAFQVPGVSELNRAQSGRLELAEWIVNPANPLTSRVIVNRVWEHLFGQGIVSTVDNFGTTGDQPSHPELLDYLASRFVESGWSVKGLVRSLVLSRAYRLGGDAPPAYREVDPANHLVWRHSPRRLDAEELRDSILAASGRLQLEPPKGSPASQLKMIEMRDNGPQSAGIQEIADRMQSRSVYLPLLRGVTPSALAAFDPVSQTLVTGQRDSTTVPTQALFLLNSAFVRKQALALAGNLVGDEGLSDSTRIRKAYWLALGRAPSDAEVATAREFVTQYQSQAVLPAAGKAAPAPLHELKPDADDMQRTEAYPVEEIVEPDSPRLAAWMALAQSLYASAEFRYVR